MPGKPVIPEDRIMRPGTGTDAQPPGHRGNAPASTSTTTIDPDQEADDADPTASAAVSWWSVNEHVAPFLETAGSWPMAGTPAWCDLSDDDPAKVAALLDAARHWVLRVETGQEAMAEASQAISAAVDWAAVARRVCQRRPSSYIPREVSR
jgi:hypothetical protein